MRSRFSTRDRRKHRGQSLTLILTLTLTRETSPQWSGRRGRVDTHLLTDIAWPPPVRPRCYVCGPTPFVETVATALVELGHDAARVKTERFGPTGA